MACTNSLYSSSTTSSLFISRYQNLEGFFKHQRTIHYQRRIQTQTKTGSSVYILHSTMTTGQHIICQQIYTPIVIYLDKDLDTIDQFQLIEMGRALCYYIKRGLWYLNRMFFNGPFKSGMMMEFEYFFYFDTQFALAVKCIDIISFELFCSFGGLLLLCYCNATTPCFFLFSALLL